jgi:phage-related protein
METISPLIAVEKNKIASPNPFIVFLAITINDTAGTKLYYCNNNENLTYSGQLYTATSFDITISSESMKGEMPSIELTIQNVDRILGGTIDAADGGLGSTIIVYVVEVDAVTKACTLAFSKEYEVMFVEMSAYLLTVTLGAPNLLRQGFPFYRYIAEHCEWRFKWHECKYEDTSADKVAVSGTSYICITSHTSNTDNAPTGKYGGSYWRIVSSGGSAWSAGVDYTEGTAYCGRTFFDCRDTFNNTPNFGGQKGLVDSKVRLV